MPEPPLQLVEGGLGDAADARQAVELLVHARVAPTGRPDQLTRDVGVEVAHPQLALPQAASPRARAVEPGVRTAVVDRGVPTAGERGRQQHDLDAGRVVVLTGVLGVVAEHARATGGVVVVADLVRVERDGADHREQAHLLVAEVVAERDGVGLVGRTVLVDAPALAQGVPPGLGELGRVAAQAGVVGEEEVRGLAAATPATAGGPLALRPPHHAADGLPEEQLRRRGRGEHGDAEPGQVDALRHHPHGDDPRVRRRPERGDLG